MSSYSVRGQKNHISCYDNKYHEFLFSVKNIHIRFSFIFVLYVYFTRRKVAYGPSALLIFCCFYNCLSYFKKWGYGDDQMLKGSQEKPSLFK